jgi:hypothetical protein
MAAQRKPESERRQRPEREDGVLLIAREVQRAHLSVAPGASEPRPEPFPTPVMRWLWGGILVGGLAGLVFGAALFQNTIAIPGWEALFSMGPFTFHAFWVLAGVALGIATLGVAGILMTRPDRPLGRR